MFMRAFVVLLATQLVAVAPVHATARSFQPAPNSYDWHRAANWAPAGVPADHDHARVHVPHFVLLFGDTAELDELWLDNGAFMLTNGYMLNVNGESEAFLDVQGPGTTLAVEPHAIDGHVAAWAGRVRTGDGGRVTMAGGIVLVDSDAPEAFEIQEDGMLTGWGALWMWGDGTRKFVNRGLISVENGPLSISAGLTGSVDLDGDGTGSVHIEPGRRFTLSGLMSGVFQGTMRIAPDAEVSMNLEWALGASGLIEFDGGSGTAMLSSQAFDGHGVIDVQGGVGELANASCVIHDTGRLIVRPGARVAVERSLYMQGTLQVELGPDDPGTDARVDVGETFGATPGGLDVTMTPGVEIGGQGIDLVRARNITGVFDATNVPADTVLQHEPDRIRLVRATPCPADVTNDAKVSVDDLVAVLLQWGVAGNAAADVDDDEQVNVTDLVTVITAWGDCP